MNSVTLRVILHGLIALAQRTDGTNSLNLMTAMLVDARNPPIQECLAPHHPMLEVTTSNLECLNAGCDPQFQCVCSGSALARKEISLQIDPPIPVAPSVLGSLPAHPIPSPANDAFEATHFGYVAPMSQAPLNLKLNPAFLGSSPPSPLLARMTFPFSRVTPCSLTKRHDDGIWNVHSMTFRPLGDESEPGMPHQAMAQAFLAEADIPLPNAGTPRVAVILRDLDDGGEKKMLLVPGDDGYEIVLSNHTPKLNADDPCDDGVGRHFRFFYDLALNPPPFGERPVPHFRPTVFAPAEGLRPPQCQAQNLHPMERPVCPMASFGPTP